DILTINCRQSLARSLDFGEDLFPFGSPLITLRLLVAKRQVLLDGGDELAHAGETSVSDRLLRDVREKTLDQVQPGTAGRREVKVKSGPLRQPSPHLGMFVRGVVVYDQMQFQLSGCFPVHLLEES